jgi:hypothetical protein
MPSESELEGLLLQQNLGLSFHSQLFRMSTALRHSPNRVSYNTHPFEATNVLLSSSVWTRQLGSSKLDLESQAIRGALAASSGIPLTQGCYISPIDRLRSSFISLRICSIFL